MINVIIKLFVCLVLLMGVLYFLGYDALGGVILGTFEWIAAVIRPVFEFLESLAESIR